VRYIDRTRAWYNTLGYQPYRWPSYDDVPFATLKRSLADSKVALITTAAPVRDDVGDQGPGAAYNGSAKFFDVYSGSTADPFDVRISHLGYDRNHTTAEDTGTWFPIERLNDAVTAGRIAGLTERFHGAPTVRRQRSTTDDHAPEIARRCLEEGADVAILVPN